MATSAADADINQVLRLQVYVAKRRVDIMFI